MFAIVSDTLAAALSAPSRDFSVKAIPMEGCAVDSTVQGGIVSRGSIIPSGLRTGGDRPNDTLWHPRDVSSVEWRANRFFVLDAVGDQISVLDDHLMPVAGIALPLTATGQRRPATSIAALPDGNGFWALVGTPQRLLRLDLSGRILDSMTLPFLGADADVLADGRVAVMRNIERRELESLSVGDSVLLVALLRPRGNMVDTVMRASKEELLGSANSLPGTVKMRLVARGKGVAVLFPATGTVFLRRGSGARSTYRACVPPAATAMYAQQLSAPNADRRPRLWLPVATDVWFDDVSSRVTLATPLATHSRMLHLEVFTRADTATYSLQAPVGTRRYPWEWRFTSEAGRMVAFSYKGWVGRFDFSPNGERQ